MPTANEQYDVRLKQGRLLRGWPLAWLCAVRNTAIGVLDGFGDPYDAQLTAPTWVVVTEQQSGRRVARVSAGRDPATIAALLRAVQDAAESLTPEEFLDRYAAR